MANRLSSEHEVCILSLCGKGKEPYFHLDEKVRVEYLLERCVGVKKHFLKIFLALRRFSQSNPEFDILIDNDMGLVACTYLAFRHNKRLKTVSIEHTHFGACKTFSLAWFGKRLACRKSDAVVVLTKQDYEDYRKSVRKIRRLEHCYNLRDVTLIRDSYNPDSRKLMSCGRLTPQKGFDMLVEVAKQVFSKYPEWQWHIYGDGPEYGALKAKIREYGLEDQVILKGFSNTLLEQYSKYSLFVLTSRMEGMAVVLVEAQANRLPIVSFDCKNGPRELILDGENGYLIDCFDIEAMAEKIGDLLQDREKRIRFSQHSQELFSKLDPEIIADRWMNLLQSL
jgi:glycosyltransferase involved in cell wall biosynthesis